MSIAWNDAAMAHLNKLYDSFGAKTDDQKMKVLTVELDGSTDASVRNFHVLGLIGEVPIALKVACMEHELLERDRIIQVTYA